MTAKDRPRSPRLAALIAVVLALAIAASASAQASPLAGEVTDPADSPGTPGQDIAEIRASYDPAAGTWTEAIRFHGPLSGADKAMFYSSLAACGSGTPSQPAPPTLAPAGMQAWTDPADPSVGAVVGGVVNGLLMQTSVPDAGTKHVSADRRTLTLSLTHPLLVGRDICFVSPSRLSSRGTVYDRVGLVPLKPRSVIPSQPGERPGTDDVAPTATVAGAIVLSRRRWPRLTISRISEPVRGTVILRGGKGRVIARAKFRAVAAGGTAKVALRVSRAVRRKIARGGRLPVTIAVTLTDAAGQQRHAHPPGRAPPVALAPLPVRPGAAPGSG
jgi:hypothetical protein